MERRDIPLVVCSDAFFTGHALRNSERCVNMEEMRGGARRRPAGVMWAGASLRCTTRWWSPVTIDRLPHALVSVHAYLDCARPSWRAARRRRELLSHARRGPAREGCGVIVYEDGSEQVSWRRYEIGIHTRRGVRTICVCGAPQALSVAAEQDGRRPPGAAAVSPQPGDGDAWTNWLMPGRTRGRMWSWIGPRRLSRALLLLAVMWSTTVALGAAAQGGGDVPAASP